MASTQVILLERVDKLGSMGEVVTVKPGYARNYLLPQRKALRATDENKAYFEAQRAVLEAENEKRRKEAAKGSEKIDGLTISIIRQAGERGQLYGSVAARDISSALAEESGQSITRGMVDLKVNIKMIGLFPVEIVLHPDVRVNVTVNVARTQDEAQMQAKTGKAIISAQDGAEEEKPKEAEAEAEVEVEVAPKSDAKTHDEKVEEEKA